MLSKIVFAYLIIVNASAFLLMRIDKKKARRGGWRIPEATLLGMAAIGGSIGAIAGMHLFRHKTKHAAFSLGLPAILILQILLVSLIVRML